MTCLQCDTLAQHAWFDLEMGDVISDVTRGRCAACGFSSYWLKDVLIYPRGLAGRPAHESTPPGIAALYDEARAVAVASPRSAGALLRLALQELLSELSAKTNINEMIGDLVARGLDPGVQQAMDFVRVVGNNAVHPGELQLDEDPQLVHAMFEMVNLIVEHAIARPAKVRELFDLLPEGARAAIDKRDNRV